ncbi:MAG TPA: hypothetical protein VL463_13855 [Kofleriaceae bacterium]|nr:hypothetical protein [Kofleriaceae bacterium]
MKKRAKAIPTSTESRPRKEQAPKPVDGESLREVHGGDGNSGWNGTSGWG